MPELSPSEILLSAEQIQKRVAELAGKSGATFRATFTSLRS